MLSMLSTKSIARAHPNAQATSKRVAATKRSRPTPVAVRKHLPPRFGGGEGRAEEALSFCHPRSQADQRPNHELFSVFMTPSFPHPPLKIVIYGRFDIIFLKTALLKKSPIPTNVYRAFKKSTGFFTNHPSEK
jgi:hypothetical protein